jgi:hypothetical protein
MPKRNKNYKNGHIFAGSRRNEVSSTNKTDRHEILLRVALNTIKQTRKRNEEYVKKIL